MPAGTERSSYSILVIEDNPGDYYLIREYLDEKAPGSRIVHSKMFSEAKKVLNGGAHSFDAILLDLTLPDLSGKKLIEAVTRLEGDAVTIVLTGHSDMEFSVKSLSMGISDYLLKDELTSNGLLKSIRYSLERRASSENLKESEERYRDLFRNNPNPMIVWEQKTGTIIDVNQKAIEKYGYNRDEFGMLTVYDIRVEKSRMENSLMKNGSEEVWMHRKKNGRTFFAEINSHSLDFNGKEASLLIVNDVTEKIEMQEKMVESAVQAEEEERNRIAKDLHDGIVQQLVACGMFTQNLQDKVDDKEKLQDEIKRLYTLIRDLTNETRDLSHNLKSAEFEITSLADLTEQLTRQLSRDSGVTFIFKNYLSFDDNFDPGFRKHLFRILQELCSNVIRHSEADKAVISMEVIDKTLFLTIKDDGIGMDAAKVPRAGIGLRNIKSRVYRLGGELELENLEDGGLQVHIELPVIYAEL